MIAVLLPLYKNSNTFDLLKWKYNHICTYTVYCIYTLVTGLWFYCVFVAISCSSFISLASCFCSFCNSDIHIYSSRNRRVRAQGRPLDSVFIEYLDMSNLYYLNSDHRLKQPSAQPKGELLESHRRNAHMFTHFYAFADKQNILYMNTYICKDTHAHTRIERGYWVRSGKKKDYLTWAMKTATGGIKSRQAGVGVEG